MIVKNTIYTKNEIARILEAGEKHKLTMSEKKLLEIYDKIYLFNGLNEEDVVKIVKNVSFKKVKKGDIILQEGEKSPEIYFILTGKVVVVTEKNKIVATIESGHMFGEMTFVTKHSRSATILSYDDRTVLLSFEIDEDKCSEVYAYSFVKLYQNIALDLARKIEKTNKKIKAGNR